MAVTLPAVWRSMRWFHARDAGPGDSVTIRGTSATGGLAQASVDGPVTSFDMSRSPKRSCRRHLGADGPARSCHRTSLDLVSVSTAVQSLVGIANAPIQFKQLTRQVGTHEALTDLPDVALTKTVFLAGREPFVEQRSLGIAQDAFSSDER